MRILTISVKIITALDIARAVTDVSKTINDKNEVERTHVMSEDVIT